MKNNIISPSCLYVHAQKFVLFLFSLIFKKSKRSSRMLFFEFKFKFFKNKFQLQIINWLCIVQYDVMKPVSCLYLLNYEWMFDFLKPYQWYMKCYEEEWRNSNNRADKLKINKYGQLIIWRQCLTFPYIKVFVTQWFYYIINKF